MSFDVEDHHSIEAAAGLDLAPELKARYAQRVAPVVHWLLDQLAERAVPATFFIVGQVAERDPALIRAIHRAGHEIASHGWDHRRVLEKTPASFRDDLRQSKDALEQITGAAVLGYRAPTFSILERTAWAIDVLHEQAFLYDSSIYPVLHDRYGVPDAPRTPFYVRGHEHELLEIPPATVRFGRMNFPVGGGGYFRLLPLALTQRALRQMHRLAQPSVAMLYFHPWEFDPEQPHLPLSRLKRFRTYVGIKRSRHRLISMLGNTNHRFTRAIDLATRLQSKRNGLPTYTLAPDSPSDRAGTDPTPCPGAAPSLEPGHA